jgi:hypothetical protein
MSGQAFKLALLLLNISRQAKYLSKPLPAGRSFSEDWARGKTKTYLKIKYLIFKFNYYFAKVLHTN